MINFLWSRVRLNFSIFSRVSQSFSLLMIEDDPAARSQSKLLFIGQSELFTLVQKLVEVSKIQLQKPKPMTTGPFPGKGHITNNFKKFFPQHWKKCKFYQWPLFILECMNVDMSAPVPMYVIISGQKVRMKTSNAFFSQQVFSVCALFPEKLFNSA